MSASLFAKPDSLRATGENVALWACIVAAPTTILIASVVFPSVSFSEFILLIVVGLAFVSISRGRLIGSSIRVDDRQFPELHAIACDVSARLGMRVPQVFVRDDPFVPITAAGIGEPYALIISSQYYEHLRRGELAFLIARELGHIAAGHTRILSLLTASGRENPLVTLVFGAWMRRTEYTADRIGLLCADGIDDALGGISISTYHSIGRRVDMRAIEAQRMEISADASLRVGEWTASMPYATNRLDALRRFDASPLAATWRARLARPLPMSDVDGIETAGVVTKRDCAPLPRRIAALAIDLVTISAILKSHAETATKSPMHLDDPDIPHWLRKLSENAPLVQTGGETLTTLFVFFVYSAILVGLSGQTLGMMVMELRVVTVRYMRPTIVQSFWRYIAAFGSALFAVALFGLFMRIHPHDRVSGTRLVRGRKAA
ncbi:MAG: RDD family protein [Candidatus Eremiobacteraeota bacterium]|nr:RDD family protein [Candidatus Eremiobacteraeota bacterium]